MAIVEPSDLAEEIGIVSIDHVMLDRLISAAQDHVERLLGFKIGARFGGDVNPPVPPSLVHAVGQLAAHWYENREATLVGVNAQHLPFGVAEIVNEFRDYTFG